MAFSSGQITGTCAGWLFMNWCTRHSMNVWEDLSHSCGSICWSASTSAILRLRWNRKQRELKPESADSEGVEASTRIKHVPARRSSILQLAVGDPPCLGFSQTLDSLPLDLVIQNQPQLWTAPG